MRRCPNCFERISDNTKKCPHCDYEITEGDEDKFLSVKNPDEVDAASILNQEDRWKIEEASRRKDEMDREFNRELEDLVAPKYDAIDIIDDIFHIIFH